MADNEKENSSHHLHLREFSEVVITLENLIVPDDILSPTPSMRDGLDLDTETDLRILGCELIQTSGILLKLPQVAMATGQVVFQRFYYSKSFVKHNMEVVAMACINLASKIEESPRRIRDVINIFHHVKQIRNKKTISPLILDQNYINLKNQVIKAERRLLKELGFCVHVKHPHKIIVMYLQVLEAQTNQRLIQCAWNYMNDSFRSNVFVRFTPETIACACIYLAARQLQLALPNNPPWFSLFLVDESDIVAICMEIMQLYKRKKPNADELERTVNEVKKIHIEAKLKAKGISSEFGTPISTSRPSSPSKISPSPLTLAGRKMKLDDDTSDGSHGGYNHVLKKKRSHSRSRSITRSKSRSSSRSRSRSPSNKRRYRSSPKKYKKESRYSKDKRRDRDYKHSHKRRRSLSYSPDAYHSPERSHSHHRKYKDTKAERERYRSRSRSRSPARDKHRSRKHNGHHNHTSRDMYRR